MDRKLIKAKSKKIMKDKVWQLFTPFLAIILIQLVLMLIFEIIFPTEETTNLNNFISSLLQTLIITPLTVGYLIYILNVVRKKKAEISQIFIPYNNIMPIFGATILATIVVLSGFLLLIVPGIIFALSYAMYQYLLADGSDDVIGVLRKSKELMKGYKWDYLVFNLSYFGWILLVPFTLGLILVWLIPYVTIGQTLYYENLLKKQR